MIEKSWKIIDSGLNHPAAHMEQDQSLLIDLEHHRVPILHFYDFENESATYGYFIKPEKYLNLENVEKQGLSLARRPTGGGITFHLTDFAFSVLLPSTHPHFSLNTLSNYAFINGIVRNVVIQFLGSEKEIQLLASENNESVDEATHFCMAKPTKYDIILNGRKIAGAAQRLTKFGLLHQGTIALHLPDDEYLKKILKSDAVLNCMKKNSSLLLKNQDFSSIKEAKIKLKQLLVDAFISN